MILRRSLGVILVVLGTVFLIMAIDEGVLNGITVVILVIMYIPAILLLNYDTKGAIEKREAQKKTASEKSNKDIFSTGD
jgi:hypothetical protein